MAKKNSGKESVSDKMMHKMTKGKMMKDSDMKKMKKGGNY